MARPQSTKAGYKAKWVPVGELKVIGSWKIFYRDEQGNERPSDIPTCYSTQTSALRRCRQLNKTQK